MSGEHKTEGEIAAEVSTAVVKLFSEFYGRGPVKAKTFLFDNYVATVLEQTLTTAEETLVKAGRERMVREFRIAFQTEMTERFQNAVEQATGRNVLTYQSQIMFDPNVCVEFFVLDEAPVFASEP